jgi:hypothetical protein
MLTHPIIEKLRALRLNGMAHALEEQMKMADIDSLSSQPCSERPSSVRVPVLRISIIATPGVWTDP